jgi:chaperonin GroES
MTDNLKPLNDRVIVTRAEEDTKTAGGIVIPDSAKEKPARGTVVAVGPGKLNDNGQRCSLEVKVGDEILYGKYSGTEVAYKGQDYLIMREDDILAIVK